MFPPPTAATRKPPLTRPIVGIISNSYLLDESYPVFAGGTMNVEVPTEVSDCMPLLIRALFGAFGKAGYGQKVLCIQAVLPLVARRKFNLLMLETIE